jgi:CelD/BcsL family acetyltransferase involved in cellulose biosynthesis
MGVTIHTSWETARFDLPPVAEATGPFPQRRFLESWWRHWGMPAELMLVEDEGGLLPLVRRDREIRFAGEAELTDYHTPLGEQTAAVVAGLVAELSAGHRLSFDSLPEESVVAIEAGLEEGGGRWETEPHEVAAVLELPSGWEDYLQNLGKKERHEIRRKRRRYQETIGPVLHETHTGLGFGFTEFVRLCQQAEGRKARFMTPPMEAFFADLICQPGWRVDLLRHQDRATASVFGYSDESGYYLYNAGYDTHLAGGSPGAVLMGSMIERAISEGLPRVDFLKGDEAYKFRLGASRRNLFWIEAST